MENVLRAMDVIPPYDNHSMRSSPGPERGPGSPPAPTAAIRGPEPSGRTHGVPTLDLGEKILAEQRRRTARKRRAPGTHDVREDFDSPREEIPKQGGVAPAPDELAQLQEIVADIVARDIERICAGLKHASQEVTRLPPR